MANQKGAEGKVGDRFSLNVEADKRERDKWPWTMKEGMELLVRGLRCQDREELKPKMNEPRNVLGCVSFKE
jgi:hypothetical protein